MGARRLPTFSPPRLTAEAKWRTLAQNVPDYLAMVDREGRHLWLNRVVKGFEIKSVVGTAITDYLHPRDHPKVRAAIRAVFATGRMQHYEVEGPGDKGRVWYTTRLNAVKQGKKVVAAILIATDITPRKRMEEGLRANEERMRVLFEQLPAVIWTTDRDLRFTSSRGAPLAVIGLKNDEVVGQTFYEYFRTRDPEFLPIAGALRALRGESSDYETYWGDHTFQTHMEALRDKAGAITGTIGVAIDVTERVRAREEQLRLEAALRQVQKVDAIGRLASGVAHDFGNSLTAIRGFVEGAERALPENHPAKGDLRGALEAVTHGWRMASSLLAFSHPEEDPARPVRLQSMLDDSLGLLRRMLPAAVVLDLHTVRGLDVWIKASPTQLQQVFTNLAINARDAMPGGGKLTISVAPAKGEEKVSTPKRVAICVSDTGGGMSAEVVARAFEPFFTTKPRGEGTGLGLSIVQGIVLRYGGRIALDSEPGRGTRVQLELPCCAAAPAAAPPPAKAPPHGGVVLVADANRLVRRALASALEAAGYEVTQAADPRAATRAFDGRPDGFSAVLLEQRLARIGAAGPFKHIRHRSRSVPIIILGETTSRAKASGARDFVIAKPFKVSGLLELIERVTRGQRKERAP